ncbi:unnamed protein product [Gongylonema pulchrum]|uniref:IRK domain-containing protein n=1 Tax=Gongylonema pulchrum TaxID=637853 RepID=A0A183D819_9BILA|nr:unnamed protein product [Gongylonema pulchrum]
MSVSLKFFYVFRYTTDACLPVFFVLSLQCVVGVFLQTMLAGIVVAKVLRPKKRKQEMRFSQVAVVGPLDDHDRRPALMIRIADIQNNLYIAEPHVRLYMATSKINRVFYEICTFFVTNYKSIVVQGSNLYLRSAAIRGIT